MSEAAKTSVITPKCMLSYPRLATAVQGKNKDGTPKGNPKFSACLVFPPGTDLAPMKAAAFAAAQAKFGTDAADKFKSGAIKSPFRTDIGDRGYEAGSVFMNVRTEKRPGCVYLHAGPDGKKPAVIAQADIEDVLYAGCFVRASLNAFYYDTDGNRGVSFALNNVQKMSDGTRIDGRKAAEDEFESDLSAAPADLGAMGL